jgi:hypothetical protein
MLWVDCATGEEKEENVAEVDQDQSADVSDDDEGPSMQLLIDDGWYSISGCSHIHSPENTESHSASKQNESTSINSRTHRCKLPSPTKRKAYENEEVLRFAKTSSQKLTC